jgi:aldehyde dehydrogenase (NAD+)
MKKPHLESTYKLFINGEWKEASDKATYKSYCPANGEVLAECAQATREDVEDAITAAWAAFETWKNVPVNERAEILNKVADIIDENREHLAMVETLDNGKPIRETLNVDIPMAAQHFRYFAGCIMASEGSANILGKDTLSLSVSSGRLCPGTSPSSWPPGNSLLFSQAAAAPFSNPPVLLP